MKIDRVGDIRCTVGEGPLWDVKTGSLLFVDLVGQTLWRYRQDGGAFDRWPMPAPIAGATYDSAGRLIVALADGFYWFDPETGATDLIAAAGLTAGVQINDIKVDRDGRLIAVAMSRDMQSPDSSILWLDGDRVVDLDHGHILLNGPCWSPDGSTFYCSDTMRNRIYAFDYNRRSAALSGRRDFADTSSEGLPDGATVDADGNIWVAMLGSGNIAVYAPTGEIVRRIAMPTKFVASVTFGGPALDRLFVTTLDPSVAGQQGDEGATFLYVVDDLGSVGLPEKRLTAG